MLCGKLYQFLPVHGSPIYSVCLEGDMKSFFSFDPWSLFKMALPTEVMRQRGD